ncbi:MAG: MarR family transcriptional regulator [Novosphingobium sp.]
MRGGRHGSGNHHRADLKDQAIALSPPPTRDSALKIGVIARQIRKLFDASVGGIGITRSQWTTIVVVSKRPGATQREIAEILEMSEASAGRVIDRLCADGMLERRPKEDDRRAHTVWVTPAATPVLEKLGEVAASQEQTVFAGLDEAELDTLERLLGKVYANVTERKSETC